ncbi:MAG TPA: N-acetyl-D-Glu racemase DgcA [Pseudolabrys sp.]|jgi:L-alanine-DL-glutamate epimerase-like enolase superfamily enzyme|nr:N-acetyl-D-Glu racemase DgcA [Pseudolabrys sp.]
MTRRLSLSVAVERWPIAGSFAISRGSKTEAVVVVAELGDGKARGRGECVPYARYGETVEDVAAAIEALRPRLEAGLDRSGLQAALRPGAARNALDCAFWDLEAKASGRSAAELAGLDPLEPLTTAYTISIGTPEEMARAAEREASRPLLKIKLGRDGDAARIAAVRRAAPDATLIVDANEGWDECNLEANLAACAEAGVTLVEQPLPDGSDGALARIARPIAVCADESAHARDSLAALAGRYDAVNVKLDKAGGLTEALAMVAEAERLSLKLMVGCMVATSLAMAPALLVAQRADVVDLDGPLLLAMDRPDGLHYLGSRVAPPSPALWG